MQVVVKSTVPLPPVTGCAFNTWHVLPAGHVTSCKTRKPS